MAATLAIGKAARRLSHSPASGRRGLWPAALALGLVMAGCGGPPPPAPTIVEYKVTAAADLNAAAGVPAPVSIRLYQLGSPTQFEQAEFFRLYRQDAAALGADLIKKEEFLLAPGATKSGTLTLPDPVHAIGVFAAFRDYQGATWRAVAAVPPHQTTILTVKADKSSVTAAAAPAKPSR